jgi:hypothetical protein
VHRAATQERRLVSSRRLQRVHGWDDELVAVVDNTSVVRKGAVVLVWQVLDAVCAWLVQDWRAGGGRVCCKQLMVRSLWVAASQHVYCAGAAAARLHAALQYHTARLASLSQLSYTVVSASGSMSKAVLSGAALPQLFMTHTEKAGRCLAIIWDTTFKSGSKLQHTVRGVVHVVQPSCKGDATHVLVVDVAVTCSLASPCACLVNL